MRVVPEDQVGTRCKRRLGHGALIIRDDTRHEMDAPMQRQHDRIGLFLGWSTIARVHQVGRSRQITLHVAAAIEKARTKRAERCELTIFADESRDHHVVAPRVPGIGRELR